MQIVSSIFDIIGSLGLFLFGMKMLSEGIQKAAGDRLQMTLNFMTGTRFTAVLTGVVVTAIIQSSSATTVMVVSFVNAGLLSLPQAIGVIFGANIGTTITAWIVSILGFQIKISHIALPAIGLGFFLYIMKKWNRQDLGETILGFGLLFLGLDLLTQSMPPIDPTHLGFLSKVEAHWALSLLVGVLVGTFITILIHSSSASTAIFLTLAHQGYIRFELAAACILGANIGTTIDAILASFNTKANAKRAALVHTLFNVFGNIWVILLFRPFLQLVDFITPGPIEGAGITNHLAMVHTTFNVLNTIIFFPFVNQFARLVSWIIKDDVESTPASYKLVYTKATLQDTPEMNILRAEKEIRGMAGVVEDMFQQFGSVLTNPTPEEVDRLIQDLSQKEALADQMREEISRFLVECARQRLNPKTEQRIPILIRIIDDLEEMTDECYGLGMLLERSIQKKMHFDKKEREQLIPYVSLVNQFLQFVKENYGKHFTRELMEVAQNLEDNINQVRDELRKRARKRLKSGANVKTELLFIDIVRKMEKLGDRAYSISQAMMEI
ncbi:MAG TPA: Na/Pi cotransporter family protein [Spirochaetales bacterium]|nr:Na/Pi cotransporter family protein [Spirochaetales bacterium]